MPASRKVPAFAEDELRNIAVILADAATHSELESLFRDAALVEAKNSNGAPEFSSRPSKWMRIFNACATRQNSTGTGNATMKLIQTLLHPRRFVGRPDVFEELRERSNQFLIFRGWELRSDGRFAATNPAQTIPEARERTSRMRSELERRNVHSDVLRFCREELLAENYFHAVLEVTKSVAAKLRDRTGLDGDGGELVAVACSLPKDGSSPRLAFNSLANESERSEHKGLANLLVGFFGTFRNTTAHAPRIFWPVSETDALDLFTLASLLHRRLDAAIVG